MHYRCTSFRPILAFWQEMLYKTGYMKLASPCFIDEPIFLNNENWLMFRYQKISNTYAPYNKDWIKEKIYILLRRQAAKAPWADRFRTGNIINASSFTFPYLIDAK